MARLFTKNVAERNSERTSMLGEVCPVVVSKHRFQPVEGPSNGGGNYDPLKVECCLTDNKKLLDASGVGCVREQNVKSNEENQAICWNIRVSWATCFYE